MFCTVQGSAVRYANTSPGRRTCICRVFVTQPVSSQKVGGFEPCEGFRSLRSELGLNLRKVLPPNY